MTDSSGFCLGVAQAPGDLVGVDERLTWLDNALANAASEDTDLLLLPELFATGYNVSDVIRANAESRDGPIARRVAKLCQDHRIAVVYGYPEKAGPNIFNAAQAIDVNGQQIGHHRKLAIPPGFEGEIFSQGSGINPFMFRGVRCAVLICYDAEFSETARAAALLGAEMLFVPTALGASWGWVAQKMIPTRGFENGVYLAYANSAGTENGLEYLGQSLIAAPDGEELARAGKTPEILTARIEPERVKAAQKRLPYLQDRQNLEL